jgi:hypothetical protein
MQSYHFVNIAYFRSKMSFPPSLAVSIVAEKVSACVGAQWGFDLHWELSLYPHVSSLSESRVSNFVCLHVWKIWLLVHLMVCIKGFAYSCMLFVGQVLITDMLSCVKSWACMRIACICMYQRRSVSSCMESMTCFCMCEPNMNQEICMYLHVSARIKSWHVCTRPKLSMICMFWPILTGDSVPSWAGSCARNFHVSARSRRLSVHQHVLAHMGSLTCVCPYHKLGVLCVCVWYW